MTTNHKAPIGTKSNTVPLRATNQRTGEVLDLEIPAARSRRHSIVGYYSLAPGVQRRLKVSIGDWAIIGLLLERQDSRNTGASAITQVAMAKELGTDPDYLHRRLANLQKRHIVYREGQGLYRVNSHVGFQGSRAAWEHAWIADRDPDWNGVRPKLEAL